MQLRPRRRLDLFAPQPLARRPLQRHASDMHAARRTQMLVAQPAQAPAGRQRVRRPVDLEVEHALALAPAPVQRPLGDDDVRLEAPVQIDVALDRAARLARQRSLDDFEDLLPLPSS